MLFVQWQMLVGNWLCLSDLRFLYGPPRYMYVGYGRYSLLTLHHVFGRILELYHVALVQIQFWCWWCRHPYPKCGLPCGIYLDSPQLMGLSHRFGLTGMIPAGCRERSNGNLAVFGELTDIVCVGCWLPACSSSFYGDLECHFSHKVQKLAICD